MYQPIRVHENIWLLYRKDMQISESHLDIRRASKGRGEIVRLREPIDAMNIRYGGKWMEWREGVGYPKSVQECRRIDSSNPEYVGHPTQKPLDLMRLIVSISTDEGDLVLDPFAGSGTTLVACRELNRRCIGIEIERKYVEAIRWRLSRRVGKITEYY
jgi:DNA modification methylase